MGRRGRWMWGCGLAVVGACLLPALAAEPVMPAFARQRAEAMKRAAARDGLVVPREYTELFAAVEADDWTAASNRFEALKARIGQYAGSTSDPAVDNALWPYAQEVFGAYEQAANWDPALLDLYAREILRVIPAGAVYFGGTDAGRFVITAYRVALDRPFHIITQNALADAKYMTYLRQTSDPGLDLPSEKDCNEAFQEYVTDVQAGRIAAGAELSIKDGRVSVSGVQGVMLINGIIARKIVERNSRKDAREFYVEESYVIAWMYPYLEPCGPIMKLNAAPIELTPDAVAKDRRFWDDYTARLMGQQAFASDALARRAASKMRGAIAGLYQARGRWADAEYAYKQALELDPSSPEARFRYAEGLVQLARFDDALGVISGLIEREPANEQALRLRDQILERQCLTRQRQELEKKVAAGGGSLPDARELLRVYEQLGLKQLAAGLQAAMDRATASGGSNAPAPADLPPDGLPPMPK